MVIFLDSETEEGEEDKYIESKLTLFTFAYRCSDMVFIVDIKSYIKSSV